MTTQNEKLVNAFINGNDRNIRSDSIRHIPSIELGTISQWIYYETTIFEHYHNDEYYKLNNGGCKTTSTKHRLNDILSELTNSRFYIQQKNYNWYLNDRTTGDTIEFNGEFEIHYDLKKPLLIQRLKNYTLDEIENKS